MPDELIVLIVGCMPLVSLIAWFCYKVHHWDRDKKMGVGFWEIYKTPTTISKDGDIIEPQLNKYKFAKAKSIIKKNYCTFCGLEKTEYYCKRCMKDDEGYTVMDNYERFNAKKINEKTKKGF